MLRESFLSDISDCHSKELKYADNSLLECIKNNPALSRFWLVAGEVDDPPTTNYVDMSSMHSEEDGRRRKEPFFICATWLALFAAVAFFWIFAIIGLIHTLKPLYE